MDITVAINDGNEYIYEALKDYARKSSEKIKIMQIIDGKIISVKVSGKREEISLMLALVLSENILLRRSILIIKRINERFSEDEKIEIIVKAIKKVWAGKSSANLAAETFKRIQDYFADNDFINIDGFFDFRMSDISKQLKIYLNEYAREMAIKKEYEEFIATLKYFVSMKAPQMEEVSLCFEENRYKICDENNVEINCFNFFERMGNNIDMEDSDMVLSMLINIAPKRIIVHREDTFPDKLFVINLKRIFERRVKVADKT